jgi:hypothetical protein
MTKINKEMAEHLLRYHTEYETTSAKTYDMKNVFTLIKYLMNEIEEMKNGIKELEEKNRT